MQCYHRDGRPSYSELKELRWKWEKAKQKAMGLRYKCILLEYLFEEDDYGFNVFQRDIPYLIDEGILPKDFSID